MPPGTLLVKRVGCRRFGDAGAALGGGLGLAAIVGIGVRYLRPATCENAHALATVHCLHRLSRVVPRNVPASYVRCRSKGPMAEATRHKHESYDVNEAKTARGEEDKDLVNRWRPPLTYEVNDLRSAAELILKSVAWRSCQQV